MTTSEQALNAFLKDAVNLPAARLEDLETHVDALWTALVNSSELPNTPTTWHQQGSWAYSTIIKPPTGKDFDADVVVEFKDSGVEPREYLLRIRRALESHGTYQGKTELKTRCVRVQYAGEHHVDLVPMVVRNTGNHIVNRIDNTFERAEPVEYVEWFNGQDDLTGGQLHKVIRLLKYLRDYKKTHATRSVILTTLLGQLVTEAEEYSDSAEALEQMAARLANYLQSCASKPHLPDPSCEGASFDHRWTPYEFQTLRRVIGNLVSRIALARRALTPASATRAWRDLFGAEFPEVTVLTTAGQRSPQLGRRDPGEEFPEEFFGRVAPLYTAHLQATVLPTARKTQFQLRHGGTVERNRKIRFRVTTNAPTGYQVHWKVKNRGHEARACDSLRGTIIPGSVEREETTLYRGHHYVEAYIVQGGRVVATARQAVVIR